MIWRWGVIAVFFFDGVHTAIYDWGGGLFRRHNVRKHENYDLMDR